MGDKESNSKSSKILVKVGVVLDTDIGFGKRSLRCIRMALSDFYASHPHYKTRLHLCVRNSNATVVGAALARNSKLILGKEMSDKESNTTSSKILVKVGVILDTSTGIGKMSLRCIRMALSDFYASHPHYKTRLHLSVRNSNATLVGAVAAADNVNPNK
ncbi:hypothetical protein LguiB_005572 [Lonicera macranthoides]